MSMNRRVLPTSTAAGRAPIMPIRAGPGPACTCKVGPIEWVRPRQQPKRELGPRSGLRGFHDAALETGGAPLTVLERVVDHWIDSRA